MAKKKILVVDDDQSITKFIKFVLERSGNYEVLCESEGKKALPTAKSFSPNLVLLDVNLPDAQGGEILEWFNEDPVVRKIPVVFLTGIVSQEEMQSGITIGGRPAIAKPIKIEVLIESIEKNAAP